MKKTNSTLRLVSLLLPAALLSGCVDRDYNLSKIDDGDDIVIGDFFEIPLGRITYTIEDIFDDLDAYVIRHGFTPSQIGQVSMPLDISNLTVYEVDDEIGGNVGDVLGDEGEIRLVVAGENHIPLSYTLTLEFIFSEEYAAPGHESFAIGPVSIAAGTQAGGSPFETGVEMDLELFEAICHSNEIRITMSSALGNVVFHRDDHIYTVMRVQKTGGINFDNL